MVMIEFSQPVRRPLFAVSEEDALYLMPRQHPHGDEAANQVDVPITQSVLLQQQLRLLPRAYLQRFARPTAGVMLPQLFVARLS
jgi:hypothetical protein